MKPTIERRDVTSADGTRIAYYTTAGSGPTVVLANGLGGNWLSFRPLLEALGDRCRFLTWDYRGLFGSARPRSGSKGYALARHVEDLAAILRTESVTEASLVGWSMGVQVTLEAFTSFRGLARNLVLMNENPGKPFEVVTPSARLNSLIAPGLRLVSRAHALATSVTRGGVKLSATRVMLKRLGVVAATLDDATLAELVAPLGELDMEPFFEILARLGEHDASHVLPTIDVPVLVVTGDRDRLVPRAAMARMARAIPDVETLVVRGGTHYAAVEYPELVALRIERFYKERGFI